MVATGASIEGVSGGAIAEGISGTTLPSTGFGAAVGVLTYVGMTVYQAGYPVDNRPFSPSVLRLPSMSGANGFVFNQGKGERR